MPVPTRQGTKREVKATAKAKGQRRKQEVALAAREAASSPAEATRLVGPRIEGDDKYLARPDMLELLYAQERVRHAETRRGKLASEFSQIETAYLYKRERKAAESHGAELERVRLVGALQTLHKELEKAYSVKVSEMTFDTDTGLINKPPA